MRKTNMKNRVRQAKVPPQNPKIEVRKVTDPIIAITDGEIQTMGSADYLQGR